MKKYYFLLVLIFSMLVFLVAVLFINARNSDAYFANTEYNVGGDINIIGQ